MYISEKKNKTNKKGAVNIGKKLISQDKFDRIVMQFIVHKMLPIGMTEDEFFRTFVMSEYIFSCLTFF